MADFPRPPCMICGRPIDISIEGKGFVDLTSKLNYVKYLEASIMEKVFFALFYA